MNTRALGGESQTSLGIKNRIKFSGGLRTGRDGRQKDYTGRGMDKEKVGQTVKLMNIEEVLWKPSTVETSWNL